MEVIYMTESIKFNKNSITYKYICEMYKDGVSPFEIEKHLKLNRKLVRGVLTEHYKKRITRIKDYNPGPDPALVLPNTKDDVFLCQLAFLANINRRTFNNFVDKIRDLNADVLLTITIKKIDKFRLTPNIDYESDLYNKPFPYLE
jgi:hypothetical protein